VEEPLAMTSRRPGNASCRLRAVACVGKLLTYTCCARCYLEAFCLFKRFSGKWSL